MDDRKRYLCQRHFRKRIWNLPYGHTGRHMDQYPAPSACNDQGSPHIWRSADFRVRQDGSERAVPSQPYDRGSQTEDINKTRRRKLLLQSRWRISLLHVSDNEGKAFVPHTYRRPFRQGDRFFDISQIRYCRGTHKAGKGTCRSGWRSIVPYRQHVHILRAEEIPQVPERIQHPFVGTCICER